jgi:hypothetical protein
MTHEQEPQPSSPELVPSDPLAALPKRVNPEGEMVTDWGALMESPTEPNVLVAYLGNEITQLADSTDPADIERRGRLNRSINGIVSLYDEGRLPGMRDVFEVTELVLDRGPDMSQVKKYLEKGYSAEGCANLYAARDTLEITLEHTDVIFRRLGFSVSDDIDIEMIDSALDAIMDAREMRFRHTAAERLIELLDQEVTLRDIIDGGVA